MFSNLKMNGVLFHKSFLLFVDLTEQSAMAAVADDGEYDGYCGWCKEKYKTELEEYACLQMHTINGIDEKTPFKCISCEKTYPERKDAIKCFVFDYKTPEYTLKFIKTFIDPDFHI